VTNDGATILSLLDIEHPAGKILVDLAQQQDKEVGSGISLHTFFGHIRLTEWLGRRWNYICRSDRCRTSTPRERAHEEPDTSYDYHQRLPVSPQRSSQVHEREHHRKGRDTRKRQPN